MRFAIATCSGLSTENGASVTLTMIVPVCLPLADTGISARALGNLLLRDDLRQVEHPADTGLVVEYLFVEVALGRCFYDKRIERGNNGSDDVCEILRFRIAVGDAQTCRKSVR
ncbi:hypothetical protein AQ947_04470 [Burkholderia pseudomallei]|nr:hypothetical protein AQ947_04470 [Burkholderia pseudomallei]